MPLPLPELPDEHDADCPHWQENCYACDNCFNGSGLNDSETCPNCGRHRTIPTPPAPVRTSPTLPASIWLYKQTDLRRWTVGYYNTHGRWEPESHHDSPEKAAARVHYLNGGK